MNQISTARFFELFDLDENGGRLIRKSSKGPAKAGSMAGSASGNGYRYVMVDGVSLLEHRVIFAMKHGSFQVAQIDHINGNKTDNRPSNLREATSAQNLKNTGKPATNTSGFKGVSRFKQTGRWSAKARVDGKLHHIGYFDTPSEASEAYTRFAKVSHGQFFKEA